MALSIVVAAAENDVIGVRNQLPWRLPDDLKRFKALTLGKPIIMGRHTFESIGRPLPGRTTIVVSRRAGLELEGCLVVPSLDRAIDAAGDAAQIMIVGGAMLYREALPLTSTIHLTRVHAQVEGDTYFPELAEREWREVGREPHAADERHAYAFTFIDLQRAAP